MIETLRKISAEAKDRLAREEEAKTKAYQEQEETRLSARLKQIHEAAIAQAEEDGEWLMVARLDENSGFWGRHERKITPSELPYGDEQNLAEILAKEGFTITAGWHSPDEFEMGDFPSGSCWCYWAISWSKKEPKE